MYSNHLGKIAGKIDKNIFLIMLFFDYLLFARSIIKLPHSFHSASAGGHEKRYRGGDAVKRLSGEGGQTTPAFCF
jgi:hypothetical protein